MIGHDPDVVYKAVVLGAGSAGLTLAIGLAGFGHEVVLVEGGAVGGDCTNVGCIPSKALLHAAAVGQADPLGWVRARRDELATREDREMAGHEQIHLVRGWGRLTGRTDPHVVEVDTADGTVEVRAEHVVVCAGSQPVTIPIDGLDDERLLTNENLFELEAVPRTLVTVGGGPISLEMATAFADLGSTVHVVELQPRLLPQEDPAVSDTVRAAFERRGISVHTGTSIERFDPDSGTAHLADGTGIGGVDRVLVAVGRRPHLDRLGLEATGVETNRRGIVADGWGRTSVDGVFAVGDVTGNTLTTHGANAIGRRTIRAIALPLPKVGSPGAMPNAVYCRPEVASVGLSVADVEALPTTGRARYRVDTADTDRGFTDDVTDGFVMVDVERFSGRILRASVVGPSAAEMIGMFTLMIDQGIGLRAIFGMIHPYPSYSRAIGQLADDFSGHTYRRLPQEFVAMVGGRIARRLRR